MKKAKRRFTTNLRQKLTADFTVTHQTKLYLKPRRRRGFLFINNLI